MHRSGGKSSSRSSGGGGASDSDKHCLSLREFQSSQVENKSCFDCGQRGPTYVNMTAGSFVCTKCSGMLRGITPPHRIKSISMSSFSAEEVEFMRSRGNVWCAKVWMGLYDKNREVAFDTTGDDEGIKEFIIQKYEKKRYYVDPSTIIHTPPVDKSGGAAAGSNGSVGGIPVQQHSTTSGGASSNLIGATLTARVQQQQQQRSNISISRPHQQQQHQPPTTQNGKVGNSTANAIPSSLGAAAVADPFGSRAFSSPQSSAPAASSIGSSVTNATTSSSPALPSSASSQSNNSSSNASFANFDAVNFDMPPVGFPKLSSTSSKSLRSSLIVTSTNTVVPPKTKSHSQTLPKRSSSGKRRVKLFNNPQGANNKFPTPKLPPPPGFNPPHVGDLNDINISAAGQLSTYSTLSSHGDLPLAPGKPKDLARNSDYGSYYSDLEDLFSAESEINVDTPLLTPGQGLTPLVNPSLSPAANLVAASLSLASNPTGGHQFLGNEVSAQITKAPATSSKPDFEIENAPLPLPKFEPAPPRLNQNNFDPSHFYGGGYEATAIFNPPISQSGVPKPPSIEPGFTMTINAVPPQVSNPNSSRFAPSLPKHESLDSDTPPKIPPKPPIIRKKLALVVQKDKLKNDYANCQKLRVTFENDLPTIEREKPVIIPGKKLAPKFENPSLPNLSKLAALSKSDSSSDEEGSSLAIDSSSLNPFSPNFRPENLSIAGGTIRPRVNSKVFDFAPKTLKRLSPDYDTNPFRQNVNSLSSSKSAFRLGEDFFTSLFSDSKPVAAPKGILKLPAISPSKDTDKDIVTNPSASHASGSNNVFSPTNPINLTNPNPTDSSSEPIPPRHHQHPSASLQPAKTGVVVHSGVALGAGMPPSSGQQGNKVMSQSDKYAALKDLDEIFKTSAVIQDSVSTTQTTGVSIFGSSPVQVAAVFPNSPADSVFGGGSAAGAVTPVASSLSTANSWNAAASNRSNSPNDWAWKERNGAGAMSAGSSTGGSAMSGVTSPPVNPFTGATNLTQLNTSPWPTTGTSPVNTAANAGSTSSNGGGGSSTMVSTMSAASSGGPSVAPAANQFGTASFPDWPSQQQQQPPVNPDPFATSNLQSDQASASNPTTPSSDLFARAPKPFTGAEENIPLSTQEQQWPGQNGAKGIDSNDNATKPTFDAFFQNIVSAAATTPTATAEIIDDNAKSNSNNNPWNMQPSNFSENNVVPAGNSKNPFL